MAITVLVIAWGYLVYAAIDFGGAARAGEGGSAWALLGLASLGAVACLFISMMLLAQVLRELGITAPPAPQATPPQETAGAPALTPEQRAAETEIIPRYPGTPPTYPGTPPEAPPAPGRRRADR